MARMIVGLVAALIVLFLAWAAIAEIDEIARGEGKVIPVSKTQIIQSSEAGVVETIARPGRAGCSKGRADRFS